MSRLFFLVMMFWLFLSRGFADSCTTGLMTVPHKCGNADCTISETMGISRDTPGAIEAILGGEKRTTSIEDQNLTISDYANNATSVNGGGITYASLGATKSIKQWKQISTTVYRVVNGYSYKYNNGVDLLNQKRSNSSDHNNPILISLAVCSTAECTKTQEQDYSVFSTASIAYYHGNVSSFTMKEYDTPIITNLYVDSSRKTNSTFLYNATFIDRIPVGCTDNVYTYNPKILTWNGGNLITQFTDSNTNNNPHIAVNKIGENLTGNISESITLGQTGLRKLVMNISDQTDNKGTRTSGLMEVIQGDINKNESSIISHQNTTTSYYPGDTLQYTIVLKDTAGNIIKDKPANFSHPTQNSSITYLDTMPIYSDAITGEYVLRISTNTPLSLIENFRASVPYWDDQGVNITTGSPQSIDLGSSSRIAIRDPNLSASEFIISCSRGPITLVASCVRDNLSGCNNLRNESITFRNESDNGANGLLKSFDNAGNVKQYRYIMQHIDTSAPVSTLKIGSIELTNNISMLANNNRLSLFEDDAHPPGCGGNINYNLSRSSNLGSNPFTFVGDIQPGRTLDFGTVNFTKNGTGQVTYTLTDVAGNSIASRRNVSVYPNFLSTTISSLNIVNQTRNSIYANDSDTYTYKLTLKDSLGNPIYGKTITGINQEGGARTIKTDMTNPNSPVGIDAIDEQWVNGINTTNGSGEVFFTVKSNTPGVFSEKFKISMHTTWDSTYQNTGNIQDIFINSGNENSFKKTFVGNLSVITSPYKLDVGTTLTMRLNTIQQNTISGYTIEQFKNQLNLIDETNHEFQNKQDAASLNNNPTIDFRIEPVTDVGVHIAPGVVIQGGPIISYNIGGQDIRYRLTTTDSASDSSDISLGGVAPSNALKIIGALQGQGKQSLAGQKSNFSDISKSNMRTVIRKNAYSLIRGMNSGQIINGIKYINGADTTLAGEADYETIIVKNGNIIIDENFNTSGKKIGIIVIRDDNTNIAIGNIYIKPGVGYIQAAIYADGGIISTGFGNDTIPNYIDSMARTHTLNKQLVINGTLFTRNTIGGAIKGSSGKYILPGGSTTNNFNIAMMYDLNYLRRGNNGYDTNGNDGTRDYNNGNSDNVVIISNPNLQKNPPKGFKN